MCGRLGEPAAAAQTALTNRLMLLFSVLFKLARIRKSAACSSHRDPCSRQSDDPRVALPTRQRQRGFVCNTGMVYVGDDGKSRLHHRLVAVISCLQ